MRLLHNLAFMGVLIISMTQSGVAFGAWIDGDGDKVYDQFDNCKYNPNADQIDTDGDNAGDACDADDDNDGSNDAYDNCPLQANADQQDLDGDNIGDACDPDDDGDGISDTTDNCPLSKNADQTDLDGDGTGNLCDNDVDGDGTVDSQDNCPQDSLSQKDSDGVGKGDACDPDADNDGLPNESDNCPLNKNADQKDLDFDNKGNICDLDDDGDGILDTRDNCPARANPKQENIDGDAHGDICDAVNDKDKDGDGILDAQDNCPAIKDTNQHDTDKDGLGNPCDPDDDGDGILDGVDNCPIHKNPQQLDADSDKKGDVCDDQPSPTPPPPSPPPSPPPPPPTVTDTDGDGLEDAKDECPTVKVPENGACPAFYRVENFAGKPGGEGRAPGFGKDVRFRKPRYLATDAVMKDFLYVADGKTIFRGKLAEKPGDPVSGASKKIIGLEVKFFRTSPKKITAMTTAPTGGVYVARADNQIWHYADAGNTLVKKMQDQVIRGLAVEGESIYVLVLQQAPPKTETYQLFTLKGGTLSSVASGLQMSHVGGLAYSPTDATFYIYGDTQPPESVGTPPATSEIWKLQKGTWTLSELNLPSSTTGTYWSNVSIVGGFAQFTDLYGGLYQYDIKKQQLKNLVKGSLSGPFADGATGSNDVARIAQPRAVLNAGLATYIADGPTIRLFSFGEVVTVAGVRRYASEASGVGTAAHFIDPERLAVRPDGNHVYVIDLPFLRVITVQKSADPLSGSGVVGNVSDQLINLKIVATDVAVSPVGKVFVVSEQGTLHHVDILTGIVSQIILPPLRKHTVTNKSDGMTSVCFDTNPHQKWQSTDFTTTTDTEYNERLGRRIAFTTDGDLVSVRLAGQLAPSQPVTPPEVIDAWTQQANTLTTDDSVLVVKGLDDLVFSGLSVNLVNANSTAGLYDTSSHGCATTTPQPIIGKQKISDDFILDPLTNGLYILGRWAAENQQNSFYANWFAGNAPLQWKKVDWTTVPLINSLALTPVSGSVYTLNSSMLLGQDPALTALAQSATIIGGEFCGAVALQQGAGNFVIGVANNEGTTQPTWVGDQMMRVSGDGYEGVKDGAGVLGRWNQLVDLAYDPERNLIYGIDRDEGVIRVVY